MLIENRPFEPTSTLFGASIGVTRLEICRDFWHQKTKSPWAIIWHCLCDPTFSHFDTVPACDRWTDKESHDDSIYCASVASRGKNKIKRCFKVGSSSYFVN